MAGRPAIAIVGIGVRLPGAEGVDEFRQVLLNKDTTYGEIPPEVWNKEEWYRSKDTIGFTNNHVAGIVPTTWEFDNGFFNISPREALAMDPQQRQIMEVTQEALEDAGILPENLPKNTGVFMSMRMGELPYIWSENINFMGSYALTGAAHTVTANRVNFFYDIMGPSSGIEASCSASSHSIHIGCSALWNNECDAVIVGGSNALMSPQAHLQQCDAGYLSRSGVCAPFDKRCDGRIRSEGTGVVILKKLEDALRDGDHIYAAIRATAIGYNGETNSLFDHSGNNICHIINKMYETFEIDKGLIDHIECNGTGLLKDDVEEMKAISQIFQTSREVPLLLSSLKANFGHLEGASGVIQLIKACLMARNREIYPQAHFKKLHPTIVAAYPNIAVPQTEKDFTNEKKMCIGINSLSFTGQVSHIVLEEVSSGKQYDTKPAFLSGWNFGGKDSGLLLPLTLSAKSPEALKELARRWIMFESNIDAAQVAGWMSTRREHFKYRLGILADGPFQFRDTLKTYLKGGQSDKIITGKSCVPYSDKIKVCFVFPGNGQQTWEMGRLLYAQEPVYKATIDLCDEAWEEICGCSYIKEHGVFISDSNNHTAEAIDDIKVCQFTIISHQLALTALVKSWGVSPDIVIGHSVGEISAAALAADLSIKEALKLTYCRIAVQQQLRGTGSMAAARFTPEYADQFVKDHEGLYVACYNSPENVTLSGNRTVLENLASEIPNKVKMIRVSTPFHTPYFDVLENQFLGMMKTSDLGKEERNGTTPLFYSSVTKDKYMGEFDASYWWDNIRGSVNFWQATKAILRDHGQNVLFIEVAATSALLGSIRHTATKYNSKSIECIPLGIRGEDDRLTALKGLLQLYTRGYPLQWNVITRNVAKYVRLPQTQWQRNYFRLESSNFRTRRLGLEDKSFVGQNGKISVLSHHYLGDCKLNSKAIFSSAASIEYLSELVSHNTVYLKNIEVFIYPRLQLPEDNIINDIEYLYIDQKSIDDRVTLVVRETGSCVASAQVTDSIAGQNSVDIGSIIKNCSRAIDPQYFYSSLAESGLSYGDSFKVLQSIYVGDSNAVACMKNVHNEHEKINTLLLDGCFQLLMASMTSFVPLKVTYVEELEVLADLHASHKNLYAIATVKDSWSMATEADLFIVQEEGLVLLRAVGIRFEEYFSKSKFACLSPLSESTISREWDLKVNCAMFCERQSNWQTLSDKDHQFVDMRKRMRNIWNVYEGHDKTYFAPCSFVQKVLKPLKNDEVKITPKYYFKVGDFYQCSGIITEVGGLMNEFNVNDEVIALACYGLSSSVQSPTDSILVKPKELSLQSSCWFYFMYTTAYHALIDMVEVVDGDCIIVLEIDSGPLSIATLKAAHSLGVKVILTGSGTDRRLSNLSLEDLRECASITSLGNLGSRRVDAVIDCTEGPPSSSLVDCIKEGGVYCKLLVDSSRESTIAFQNESQIQYVQVSGVDFLKKHGFKTCEIYNRVSHLLTADPKPEDGPLMQTFEEFFRYPIHSGIICLESKKRP